MNPLSMRWLQFMVWYGPQIAYWSRRLGIGAVVLLCVGVIFAAAKAVFNTSILSARIVPERSAILAQGYVWSHAAFTPQSVSVSTVDVFANANGGVNVLTEVSNPNPLWVAHAQVSFVSDRTKTPAQDVAVLPGVSQPVVAVGIDAEEISSSITAVVESIWWTPLPSSERALDSSSRRIVLAGARSQATGTTIVISATVANETAHHYRDVRLLLRWYEGTRVMGFQVFSIRQLGSGQRQHVTVAVPSAIAGYARFQMDPLFDLTDPDHFFIPQPSPRNVIP